MLSEQINVALMGVKTTIGLDASVPMPDDTGTYTFEYFYSHVDLEDEEGLRSYEGNVCILYPPGIRKSPPNEQSVTHTWFHLNGPGVEPCLDRYRIPVNHAMVNKIEPSALIAFLEGVRRHNMQRDSYWEDAVTILSQTFFRNLGRSIAHGEAPERSSIYQKEILATLRRVRAEIHANLDRRWTVDEMAALANLSYSYYRNIFTRFFNVSPIEDLTRARIRRAKLLLRSSRLTVREIAEHCGFCSTSQFYVYFRERTGQSPGDIIRMERSLSGSPRMKLRATDTAAIDDVSLLYHTPVGIWKFDELDGDPDQDYHFRYEKVQFHHGATVGAGLFGGGALYLHGDRSYAEIPEPVVNTEESYTVSAWVQATEPVAPTEWMTAVSIGNEHQSSFFLQYCLPQKRFMFTVTPSATDFNTIHAVGSQTPECGKWFHLTGVHDRQNKKIMLWENGELSSTLDFAMPWKAEGSTRFGASVYWGALTDLWTGKISEVRFYDRALSEMEIKTIYRCLRAK